MSFSSPEFEEFKAEALELLEVAEKSLLALDQGADFKNSFDSVFRCFHNLKGAAGMMDLQDLQHHTHELENILMGFKNETSLPKEAINLFLNGIDRARKFLDGESAIPVVVQVSAAAAVMPASAIEEFVTEAEEQVERIALNLQYIESRKFKKSQVDELYRDVHSLKGSAYLFSFAALGDVGHAMESSLEKVRAGTHQASSTLLHSLFKSLDCIDQFLKRIKEKKSFEDLASTVPALAMDLAFCNEQLEPMTDSDTRSGGEAPHVNPSEVIVGLVGENQEQETKETPAVVEDLAAEARAPSSSREVEVTEGVTSIRVPVNLLDNLMTLMGEMVLVRNQVLQYSNRSEDLEFHSMSKRLNIVTSEIQGEMMKTRMQPIGNVLAKFNRVVRDLSHDLKKSITLNLQGAETELDKSLLEAIKDPLTHIVRNSCDHGIELPEVRRQAGKPEGGTIGIKAYHEGGQVVIEVGDNGKGLHPDVILKKAIEKGLLLPAQAARLSEKEIFNLIFAPGFSTAAKVTNVSGRGVGMDVVRTNIEKIGGTVDLTSEAGQGTSIKIKIPLTLAIVPALLVKCGSGTFAIPQVKLEELVRVDQNASEHKVEILHGAPVYRLRGNILPLVDLGQVLRSSKESMNYEKRILNIAVLNAEQCLFGLIIDEVQDTADIVVKPLNRLLKSLQIYSGATVLGDGSVGLILDVQGLSKVTQIGQEKAEDQNSKTEGADKAVHVADFQDFLLVRLQSSAKHALALAYVHRLEEFKTESIEYSGSQMVIRYGKTILPLVFANESLGYGTLDLSKASLSVVVIQKAESFYGLVVNEILDTLSTANEMDDSLTGNALIFGNLNLKDELIVVLNPFALIAKSFPEKEFEKVRRIDPIQTSGSALVSVRPASKERVLLAEDTAFFRRTIRSVLEKNGFEVVVANDGQEALDALNKPGARFSLIVSDIEMPRLNGFQLAQSVRKHPTFAKIPMVAVSSRADQKYVQTGLKAGFNMYLEKLKPEVLMASINELLNQVDDQGAA